MSEQVYGGATIRCSFGLTVSRLLVMPTPAAAADVLGGGFPANILDNQPHLNVPPFGMCTCPGNPLVAAAMAAQMGAPTPQACIPVTASPWVPGDPTNMVRGQPGLTAGSSCFCAYGGVITVVSPR